MPSKSLKTLHEKTTAEYDSAALEIEMYVAVARKAPVIIKKYQVGEKTLYLYGRELKKAFTELTKQKKQFDDEMKKTLSSDNACTQAYLKYSSSQKKCEEILAVLRPVTLSALSNALNEI